jgi:hypothetical protein
MTDTAGRMAAALSATHGHREISHDDHQVRFWKMTATGGVCRELNRRVEFLAVRR